MHWMSWTMEMLEKNQDMEKKEMCVEKTDMEKVL